MLEALKKCQNPLDQRPVLYFLVGPNGSGKSTLFEYLKELGQSVAFINADEIKKIIENAPQPTILAQKIADVMRKHYVEEHDSFATETVFSDEVGEKINFLRNAALSGYRVVLLAVWIPSVAASIARVRQRVKNGGHSVPEEKLLRRYHACMDNIKTALTFVDTAIIFDNSGPMELGPKPVVILNSASQIWASANIPNGIKALLPSN